jgi:hypothetical protein
MKNILNNILDNLLYNRLYELESYIIIKLAMMLAMIC